MLPWTSPLCEAGGGTRPSDFSRLCEPVHSLSSHDCLLVEDSPSPVFQSQVCIRNYVTDSQTKELFLSVLASSLKWEEWGVKRTNSHAGGEVGAPPPS